MKKYFAVLDPCSGKDMLYQIVRGEPGQGFDIVAAGHNIGALADSLVRHADNNGGRGIEICVKPPSGMYWMDIKPEARSKTEIGESDVEFHQTEKIENEKMHRLMARLDKMTKNRDYLIMFSH
jgi:hypothetical protein